MIYLCKFRGCERFTDCPLSRRLNVIEHSDPDETTGEPLYFAVCDEVDHTVTALTKSDLMPDDSPGTDDKAEQNKAQINAPDLSCLAKEVITEIRKQPLDTRLVDVTPSAGKLLHTALEDPGKQPKTATSEQISKPFVCLEHLREIVKKYLPKGKIKHGLLKDEDFLNTLVELSKAHAPGYEIYKENADDITALWMEIRLNLIAYLKTLEHNEIVDNFIRSLEHKDNHSFYTHFKRPEQESVLINEGLAKEFHFIAWKCRENAQTLKHNLKADECLDEQKTDEQIFSQSNIEFQKKLYCDRFKASKDFTYIFDTSHARKEYPSIQNIEEAAPKVREILKKLFAAYGKKRTGGWVYSGGGTWGPHFGKKPYSTFKEQQISVRRNPSTNKSEWRIIPLAEFDEESPIGLHSKHKNHSNLKNNF